MIRLTIQNYRCFVAPAVVEFSPGFTAFVGVNNAGKSALIRFFVEFRNLFALLQNQTILARALTVQQSKIIPILHVFDSEEAFSNLNDNSIELNIEFMQEDPIPFAAPTKITIEIRRSLDWTIQVFHKEHQFKFHTNTWSPDNRLLAVDGTLVDFSTFFDISRTFDETLYIGPFRNIINVGANTNYFDIQIGDAFVAQFRDLKTGASKKNSIRIQKLIDDVRRIF